MTGRRQRQTLALRRERRFPKNVPIAFPSPLAPHAARAEKTRGRLYAEPESETRTPFARDRDRIIHSVAFRRLKHKTQVFVFDEGDHYRTRLTHSLEVAQIARTLCRRLRLDEDLGETVALAHDLGHPPFGHVGEEVLEDRMAAFGGFDHNAQTLRVLTKLERHRAAYEGLNLSWETLEGAVKHNGPLTGPDATIAADLPAAVAEYTRTHDLRVDSWPSVEAQIAAVADDIAYNSHDAQDGIRAGLFSVEEALEIPLLGAQLAAVRADAPGADDVVVVAEAVSRLIGQMTDDVYRETTGRLEALAPADADAVRGAGRAMVAFSPGLLEELRPLRAFLFERMYRHTRVNRFRAQARRVVRDLFDLFLEDPSVMPDAWRARRTRKSPEKQARVVCDYVAGMTDGFAIREHRDLVGLSRW